MLCTSHFVPSHHVSQHDIISGTAEESSKETEAY